MLLKKIKQLARRLAVFFIDSFFPVACLACGNAHQWLCTACRNQIIYQPQVCPVCRRVKELGATCDACHSYLDGVLVMTEYQGLVKRAIRACKYNFAYEIGEELAQLLTNFFQTQGWDFDNTIIIPMPLSNHRFNWRGFNQSEFLARGISRTSGWEFKTANLIKVKETEPQAKLSWRDRLQSQRNCFAWLGEPLDNQTVILIDDVMTTGATLEAATRILKLAGAGKVWGLVLARGK